jgi:hypothetical protein
MTLRTSALIATLFTLPASVGFADVSPQQVWENWQLFGSSMGQSYTAQLDQQGDTLIARDVMIGMSGFADDLVTLQGHFPSVQFKTMKRGQVEITFPEAGTYTSTITGNPTFGIAPFDIRNTVTIGNTIIASGTPDEITYTAKSGTVTYTTDKQIKDGVALVPEQIVSILGLEGEFKATQEDDQLISHMNLTAEAMSVSSSGTTDEITMQSDYKAAPVSLTADFTNMTAALEDQASFLKSLQGTAHYSFGNTTFESTTGDAAKTLHITGETQDTSVMTSLLDGTLSYTGSSAKTEVVLDGSAVPFPQLDFGLETAEIGFTTPFLASPDAKPIGIQLALENLRLPEIAWMMLDASGQLPHDPATVRLDLTGTVVSGVDLMNPQSFMDTSSGTLPFNPIDLVLNEIFLSVGGATLSGNGEATFVDGLSLSNSKMPLKTASATLALNGGTALIDTLAQTGLVAPQLSTTAKMLLGIFARPGDGPDSYVTDIELKEGAPLTLNGQQLPF